MALGIIKKPLREEACCRTTRHQHGEAKAAPHAAALSHALQPAHRMHDALVCRVAQKILWLLLEGRVSRSARAEGLLESFGVGSRQGFAATLALHRGLIQVAGNCPAGSINLLKG